MCTAKQGDNLTNGDVESKCQSIIIKPLDSIDIYTFFQLFRSKEAPDIFQKYTAVRDDTNVSEQQSYVQNCLPTSIEYLL